MRALESALIARPDAGTDLGGGLRKLRWSVPGKGKRGGIRVIYFWIDPNDFILFLYAFKKNEQGDLTRDQEKALRAFVKENFK